MLPRVMRLLMVTRESHADKRYGLGKSLLPVVEALRARGHEVQYLCKADWGVKGEQFLRRLHRRLWALSLKLPGATLDTPALVWAFLERLNMGRLAAKVTRREGMTHVHMHDPWIGLGFFLFRHWYGVSAAYWGVTQHGFGCYSQATHEDGGRQGTRMMRLLRKVESRILWRADWVIAPTEATRMQIARDLAVYPVPQHWHAVPHPRPVQKTYSREEARTALGWQGDSAYVLGVGRLAPLKQFPLIVDACIEAQRHGPIQLVVLGEGNTEGLQAYATEKGLRAPILFSVTDDVALYLSACDVYVSTSMTESFGLANLEALVAGVPAVCTAVGGVPEVVGAGAWLVASDSSAVAEALVTLISEPRLAVKLSKLALDRGRSWPNAESIALRYEEIYLAPARQR